MGEVDADAGLLGGGGDPVRRDETDLQQGDVGDDRQRHVAELAQPGVDAPFQLQMHPGLTQERHQDHGLQHHAESAADTQDEQLRIAHPDRVESDLAGHQGVQHEGRDLDDVVQHRSPSARFEQAAQVEHGDE